MAKHRLRSACACVAVALLVAACSGGTTGGSSPSGSGQITGTIGGETFAFRSGIAHVGKGNSVDIILSDNDALCASMAQKKFHAGETIVQAYNLSGTAPGKFTPANNDVKYASIRSTCATGAAIDSQVDKKGRATSSEFTISSITSATVDGKLTVTFDDGSSVSGTFSVPICADNEAEGSVCF